MEKLMQNKKGIVMGVTNDISIAWAASKLMLDQGAEIIFSYPRESIGKRVEALAKPYGCDIYECDVSVEGSIEKLFKHAEEKWGKIDFVLHSIAFSDKNELRGSYVDTTLANFLNSMHISCYSLVEVAKYASPLMKDGGSMLTYTYYGAEKIMPNYNVMGVAKSALECSVKYLANDLGKENIRVNAISAGPIKTLAASGIGDFDGILNWNHDHSPLRRNVTQEEVGKSSLYLLSDLSSGVTGEIHHVDVGYNIIGMKST